MSAPAGSTLDLRQLAIDRGQNQERPPQPRHVASRYLLPLAILLGFVLVLGWAARDSLLPSTPVSVVPVIATQAEVQAADTPLFQAAGWVEPSPRPVAVAALAEGVVEKILVVEGEEVAANQPIAQLIETDARLALQRAEADLALKDAELAGAKAELSAAKTRLAQPVHLEAALAEAESLLAQAEAELARLPYDLRGAEARLLAAEQDLRGKLAAAGAVAERLVQRAQAEVEGAKSNLEDLRHRQPRQERVVETLCNRREALARQLEMKVDESRQLGAAQAKLDAAEAQQRQAKLAVEAAKLTLERMTVRAPVAGRVLKILATPGARMGAKMEQGGGAVLSLYDPKTLQVRADVRLENVGQVQPGQRVRIETASAAATIEGEVLYATSVANIQKNTLEVKVALKSPPPAVRPEMLVQATFLAPETPTRGEAKPQQRLLVPKQLVEKSESGAAVWVADPKGFARRQSIKLGAATRDDLIEVLEGLYPTDKIIASGREQLEDGERIRIRGEES